MANRTGSADQSGASVLRVYCRARTKLTTSHFELGGVEKRGYYKGVFVKGREEKSRKVSRTTWDLLIQVLSGGWRGRRKEARSASEKKSLLMTAWTDQPGTQKPVSWCDDRAIEPQLPEAQSNQRAAITQSPDPPHQLLRVNSDQTGKWSQGLVSTPAQLAVAAGAQVLRCADAPLQPP